MMVLENCPQIRHPFHGALVTHGLTSALLFVLIQVGIYLKTCQSVPMIEAIH